MKKFNPYKLRRPAAPVRRKEFADPQQPDAGSLDLALLERRGYNMLLTINEKAQEFERLYVTGYKHEETGEHIDPVAIIPPGSEALDVPASLCFSIARLMRLQGDAHEALKETGEELPDPLDFESWVIIAANCQEMFAEILVWSNEIPDQEKKIPAQQQPPTDGQSS